jgi:hypothetical protein
MKKITLILGIILLVVAVIGSPILTVLLSADGYTSGFILLNILTMVVVVSSIGLITYYFIKNK